jgi:type II secretory ATPase GspE/PulE/Tfp pilus assembly ATPase PilB-like protein
MFAGGQSFKGAGCDKCDDSGCRGRIGFFEMMTVTAAMRAAITDGRTSRLELLRTASPEHVSMRTDGIIKAALGETTVEEVLRATQDAEDTNGRAHAG